MSDERKDHLETEHPEMENQYKQIALTLAAPDRIVRSKIDTEVELHYHFFEKTPVTSKHLCVVVKANREDPFIITVYFTDSVKKGEVLWERK